MFSVPDLPPAFNQRLLPTFGACSAVTAARHIRSALRQPELGPPFQALPVRCVPSIRAATSSFALMNPASAGRNPGGRQIGTGEPTGDVGMGPPDRSPGLLSVVTCELSCSDDPVNAGGGKAPGRAPP